MPTQDVPLEIKMQIEELICNFIQDLFELDFEGDEDTKILISIILTYFHAVSDDKFFLINIDNFSKNLLNNAKKLQFLSPTRSENESIN